MSAYGYERKSNDPVINVRSWVKSGHQNREIHIPKINVRCRGESRPTSVGLKTAAVGLERTFDVDG